VVDAQTIHLAGEGAVDLLEDHVAGAIDAMPAV